MVIVVWDTSQEQTVSIPSGTLFLTTRLLFLGGRFDDVFGPNAIRDRTMGDPGFGGPTLCPIEPPACFDRHDIPIQGQTPQVHSPRPRGWIMFTFVLLTNVILICSQGSWEKSVSKRQLVKHPHPDFRIYVPPSIQLAHTSVSRHEPISAHQLLTETTTPTTGDSYRNQRGGLCRFQLLCREEGGSDWPRTQLNQHIDNEVVGGIKADKVSSCSLPISASRTRRLHNS